MAGEPRKTVKKSKPSRLLRLLILATALAFVFVVLAIAFFILSYTGRGQDVVVEVFNPDEVVRGVPFKVEVQIGNQADTILRSAVLALNLPLGIINLDSLGTKGVAEEEIGDIGSGSLTKKTYQLLPVGESGSRHKINLELSYGFGRSATFSQDVAKEIHIKDSAIKLEIAAPDQILGGSLFDLDIEYKNISDFEFDDIALSIEYPTSFKFVSSSITPSSLNNYWRLGGLRSGSNGKLKVTGRLEGVEDTAFKIPITFFANFLGEDYPIRQESVVLRVAPAPISLQVLVNRQSEYVARIGDKLTYTIQYKNMSGIAISDVVIKASLISELFNFATARTQALYNALTNTFTWNVSNTPALKLLEPGAASEVSLEIQLKNTFPMRRLNDKNFYLRLKAEIDSPTVPYYLQAPATKAFTTIETKVAGLIFFDAQAFYRDATSGVLNTGKIPPRINESTDYTIHWVLRNFSTDLRNVSVKTFLQPGVTWTGAVKSSGDSLPLYNERTQEVVWTIEKIPATKGILGDPVEAVFQVRATPNINQVGQFQPLIRASDLRATDDFTGLGLAVSDVALDTSLPDDKTVGQGGGRVVP